jgi:hypothetical protein
MDLTDAVLYHLAFSLAAELAEANAPNTSGRFHSNLAAGGTHRRILAEVVRRMGDIEPEGRELVQEAVEDALEKKRPKW